MSMKFMACGAAIMLSAGLSVAANAAAQNPRAIDRYNQGYEDGYEEGWMAAYRRGYDDARAGRRFDDRIVDNNTPEPNELWQRAYGRLYTYNDDIFYRECRNQAADPGGVIANALIGGLLGQGGQGANAQASAAEPGVIVTGPVGVQLTRTLNCEDRSYAYKTYYDALNNERVNLPYEWRNIRTGRRGTFMVERLLQDQSGFRCANFVQNIYAQGRVETARGRACQQPDGVWVVVA